MALTLIYAIDLALSASFDISLPNTTEHIVKKKNGNITPEAAKTPTSHTATYNIREPGTPSISIIK